jgi:uncharacterized protein
VRIAVIADTHMPRGARRLPDACVERLRAADLILHAGDLVSLAVLQELRGLGPPVQAVSGNMDEPAVRGRLPAELVVEAGGARIGMVHIPGEARDRAERLKARFPGCAAVVYGHTHVPEATRVGDVWVVNPGSPTEKRRARSHAMAELEITGGAVEAAIVPLT